MINWPTLPAGVAVDDLNPDLAALHELAQRFVNREVKFSYGGSTTYQEVQVGYVRRPAWYPSVSLVTADSDFSLESTGNSAGMRARRAQSEVLISVQYEDPDTEQGFARLSDLKWDLAQLAAQASGGGAYYKYLRFGEIESVELVPEDPETDLAWGFRALVMLPGTLYFK